MSKLVVYLDLDGVMANFDGALPPNHGQDPPEMFEPGFFRNLKVMPGAKKAVTQLLQNNQLSVYIGSKPTTKALTSATEKYEWVARHFPPLLKRIVLCCDKALLRGDVLVDDDSDRWEGSFRGCFIRFDRSSPRKSWKRAIETIETLKSKI